MIDLTGELPSHWPTLCAVVFLLGAKHGFDADHLAAIDGMTRLQARHQGAWARWCGALFSLGHGAVVVAIALAVSLASARWQAPNWLDGTGTWVSISVLLLLGIVNLHAVLAAPAGAVVRPVGLKGRGLAALARWVGGRPAQARHPLAMLGVGALFALSFDTVSQAALFALTGATFGGPGAALVLGLLFTAGMLATDALNGWWIARLIARADQVAAIASRVMSLAIAAVSLLVAALALARQFSARVDGWAEHQGLGLGAMVVAVLALSYLAARVLARGARGTAQPS